MNTNRFNSVAFLMFIYSIAIVSAISLTKLRMKTKADCTTADAWNQKIANGQIAPWTYTGGNQVVYNDVLYQANWGGSEVPGSKKCDSEADCKNQGIQWFAVKSCTATTDATTTETVSTSDNIDYCSNNDSWSQQIANGQIAPWTYKGGDQVVYNNVLYQANWGGSEIPGSRQCDSEADCKNQGIQWFVVKSCTATTTTTTTPTASDATTTDSITTDTLTTDTLTTDAATNDTTNKSSDICTTSDAWNQKIANGQIAPWTYTGGNQVVYNDVLYQANWGGSEVPGSKHCNSEADCRNQGIQWFVVQSCTATPDTTTTETASNIDYCTDYDAWSQQIATGQIAPWTYKVGDQVVYNDVLYQANWGGSEVPGSRQCDSEADCKNQGIQWFIIKSCTATTDAKTETVSTDTLTSDTLTTDAIKTSAITADTATTNTTIKSSDICNTTDDWSQQIATGQIAPWTYKGGDQVVNNDILYQANWGGSEVPGSKQCDSEADCKNQGIQWFVVKSCVQKQTINTTTDFLIDTIADSKATISTDIKSDTTTNIPTDNVTDTNTDTPTDTTIDNTTDNTTDTPADTPADTTTDSTMIDNNTENTEEESKDICNTTDEFDQKHNYSAGDQVIYNKVIYQANFGGSEVPGSKKCIGEADCNQWLVVKSCDVSTEVEPIIPVEDDDSC